jgi:hypothetical protein
LSGSSGPRLRDPAVIVATRNAYTITIANPSEAPLTLTRVVEACR